MKRLIGKNRNWSGCRNPSIASRRRWVTENTTRGDPRETIQSSHRFASGPIRFRGRTSFKASSKTRGDRLEGLGHLPGGKRGRSQARVHGCRVPNHQVTPWTHSRLRRPTISMGGLGRFRCGGRQAPRRPPRRRGGPGVAHRRRVHQNTTFKLISRPRVTITRRSMARPAKTNLMRYVPGFSSSFLGNPSN